MRAERSLAYFALVAGILCIAWSAIFVRWTDIPGPASAFYRLLIPALVLAPTWLMDRNTPRVRVRTFAIICMGGLFFALDLAFYNTSILRTSAANATLLGNNTPIFVGLLSWIVLRRRPSAAFWLGLVLALAGSLVIVWGDLTQRAHLGWGDAMALSASACFAVYLMATEEVRGHTGTLVFLRLAIVSSTLFLLVINLVLRVPLGIPSAHSFAALLGLGLISQLGGYFALTYAMGHLPATVTSVSLLSQGPLTAVLAALFLREPLIAPLIIGGALVLLGIALANRLKSPEQEANAALCEASEAAQGETNA
ncbi:MAG TPA: DMT family transporter [Candidatus Sulfotelmatobacter sp.]|jgi:drug/metabolite transporter (DMT)-like permease|nr:DMT family transporter [Candidatus Sulfotelmatobacter sp.]